MLFSSPSSFHFSRYGFSLTPLPGSNPLYLKCDILVPKFASKCRYDEVFNEIKKDNLAGLRKVGGCTT
jgi:hypothetical protein